MSQPGQPGFVAVDSDIQAAVDLAFSFFGGALMTMRL
tara:strand:+ start:780 stop:890 length:111 start_codon:yes stop_codon:yes gene_type:complete